MKTQVCISGGGIAGLTLALKLAQCEIDVTVIEKDRTPSVKYKGELLQPKSLEILSKIGLYEEVYSRGFPLKTTAIKEIDGDRVLKEITFHYNAVDHPFNYALMVPHETLKSVILEKAKSFPHFHYLRPMKFTGFKEEGVHKRTGMLESKEEGAIEIEADFFIGAEGRISPIRKSLGIPLKDTEYNHYFLTVSFPRPESLTEAIMIVEGHYFLGLFPLPDQQVRTVLLIKPEEYKQMKREGLPSFYDCYTRLFPDLDGYVQQITSWKDIQLMIPIRHNAKCYVSGNCALMGDAIHSVHPMAGEGMNLAIQDAHTLGDLLCCMYENGDLRPEQLKLYESVRKPRAEYLSKLSHQSALAYSYWQPFWRRIRTHVLKRMETTPSLHFKQMLNISGLGIWKETWIDRLVQIGMLPKGVLPKVTNQERHLFDEKDEQPWKFQS
ncbi:2-polyprenyl-6-methoxyphenol hydroxylase-like FAD-dependent oxidoreductase [Bacillus ectoiniformans]|uniref:FAD-dependent oxidoreductase n=1 Tax=Bacillus ectoiniformans TaxID=1494429 RepID=UPI00195740D4|nr:NAD(P)/FAD-dependent oxidoreductase [Bacillus ectoiniformans]MBM7648249.1 2-polyprenyl-6-methoxyphenol hydroxylase-like FAD-dependent oxidoreductase [Bacillus ectoiniformans]